MIDLKDSDLYKVQQQAGVSIIDCWAPWCIPCRSMDTILEKLQKDVHIFKVNVEECPHIVSHFNIQGVPTLVYFKDGKEIMHNTGSRTLMHMTATIEQIRSI